MSPRADREAVSAINTYGVRACSANQETETRMVPHSHTD